MKLDKNQQKQLISAIRISADSRGYKARTNTIYKVIDKAFIHCDFLVVNSQKLIYRIYIKNYDYDDIFCYGISFYKKDCLVKKADAMPLG